MEVMAAPTESSIGMTRKESTADILDRMAKRRAERAAARASGGSGHHLREWHGGTSPMPPDPALALRKEPVSPAAPVAPPPAPPPAAKVAPPPPPPVTSEPVQRKLTPKMSTSDLLAQRLAQRRGSGTAAPLGAETRRSESFPKRSGPTVVYPGATGVASFPTGEGSDGRTRSFSEGRVMPGPRDTSADGRGVIPGASGGPYSPPGTGLRYGAMYGASPPMVGGSPAYSIAPSSASGYIASPGERPLDGRPTSEGLEPGEYVLRTTRIREVPVTGDGSYVGDAGGGGDGVGSVVGGGSMAPGELDQIERETGVRPQSFVDPRTGVLYVPSGRVGPASTAPPGTYGAPLPPHLSSHAVALPRGGGVGMGGSSASVGPRARFADARASRSLARSMTAAPGAMRYGHPTPQSVTFPAAAPGTAIRSPPTESGEAAPPAATMTSIGPVYRTTYVLPHDTAPAPAPGAGVGPGSLDSGEKPPAASEPTSWDALVQQQRGIPRTGSVVMPRRTIREETTIAPSGPGAPLSKSSSVDRILPSRGEEKVMSFSMAAKLKKMLPKHHEDHPDNFAARMAERKRRKEMLARETPEEKRRREAAEAEEKRKENEHLQGEFHRKEEEEKVLAAFRAEQAKKDEGREKRREAMRLKLREEKLRQKAEKKALKKKMKEEKKREALERAAAAAKDKHEEEEEEGEGGGGGEDHASSSQEPEEGGSR